MPNKATLGKIYSDEIGVINDKRTLMANYIFRRIVFGGLDFIFLVGALIGIYELIKRILEKAIC